MVFGMLRAAQTRKCASSDTQGIRPMKRKTVNFELAKAKSAWLQYGKEQGWDSDIVREGLRMLLAPMKAKIMREGKKEKSRNRPLPLLERGQ
jgi:hypothetical protein